MGTYGLLTELTFRLLPRPPARATLAIEGLDDARALAALSTALGSPFEASGAAHIPARGGAKARTLVRIEHLADSVAYRSAELTRLLAAFGAARRLDDGEADALWRDVRDARLFAAPDPRAVWRVATAPSRAAAFVAAVRAQLTIEHYFDWGGGLVWIACGAAGDAGASVIRGALGRGGAATLLRAPDAARATVDVFQPQAPALAKIDEAVRARFDPQGLFDPGRMRALG